MVLPWGLINFNTSTAQRANYSGRGTAPVASYPFGLSPYGAYLGGGVL